MPERLKDLYLKEIVPKLMLKFQYKNKFAKKGTKIKLERYFIQNSLT